MRTKLSLAQRQQYREEGFCIIPGFLDDVELEIWRAALDEVTHRSLHHTQPESAPSAFDDGAHQNRPSPTAAASGRAG